MTVNELKYYKEKLKNANKELHGKIIIEYQFFFESKSKMFYWLSSDDTVIWASDKPEPPQTTLIDWRNVIGVYERSKNPEYFL
jgi:hypothetical protein